jgi:stage V sporulation protein S
LDLPQQRCSIILSEVPLETVRVSGQSRPNSVAGAIAALLRLHGEVEVQAIGALAVNQAVKAIAIARSYISPDGLDLSTVPSFVKLALEAEERTAMKFVVVSKKLDGVPIPLVSLRTLEGS